LIALLEGAHVLCRAAGSIDPFDRMSPQRGSHGPSKHVVSFIDSNPARQRRTDMRNDTSWLARAACVGHDPTWWSDPHDATPAAVQLCLGCPVRKRCLDDALRNRDNGVIRGGMWLARSSRGYTVTSLICRHCKARPVQVAKSAIAQYCGYACYTATDARAA
jgi:WhiB family redox-sensing transcriptional regulator